MKVRFFTLFVACMASAVALSQDVTYKLRKHTVQFRIDYRASMDTDFSFAFIAINDSISVLPSTEDPIPWPHLTYTTHCLRGKKTRIFCDVPKLAPGESYIFWYSNGREEGSHRIRILS